MTRIALPEFSCARIHLFLLINIFSNIASVAHTLFAQSRPIKFERIQVVQGQRLGDTLSLQQDSLGFMWFGTQYGLYKYDGYGVIAYKHDRKDFQFYILMHDA